MARSINRIVLVGHMGEKPEVRTTNAGAKMVRFNLATTRKWKKKNGDPQEKTEWHRIIAWNGAIGAPFADIVTRYGRKGLRCYVDGRVEYRNYEGRDGTTIWVTEVYVQEFVALDAKEEPPEEPPEHTSRYVSP